MGDSKHIFELMQKASEPMTLTALWKHICDSAPPGDFYLLGSVAAQISGITVWWEPRDLDLRTHNSILYYDLNSYLSQSADLVSILNKNRSHISYCIGSFVVDLCLTDALETHLRSRPWLHQKIALTRDGAIVEHDRARDLWQSRTLELESPDLLHRDPEGYTNLYIQEINRGWRDPDLRSRRELTRFGFLK